MRRALTLLSLVGVAFFASPVAHAAVTVTVGGGTVNQDGSVTVPVTVTCSPASRVLEAHLSLSQDDGAVWGMAGLGSVRCNGRPNTYVATVRPYDGSFHAGTAHASTYVLVQRRGTGETESGGSFGEIALG